MTFANTTDSIQNLQEQVRGSVLTPNHPDYERVRRGWNLSINHHPALILVPQNAEDVAAGVHYARESHLGIAIQSTGHGIQRPADDNLLIVTSDMKAVQVDAQARTARVEAGVIWQQVVDASVPHGLAPLLGSSPHVGVIGYTLGGGIGWLARRYGLAADSVRSIEIVTADGELRTASPTENSDLFWGLRGGGGNFGVVTAIEFALYPVASVYGGSMIYPPELATDALHFFREWTKNAPDELTSSITILKFPDVPQMPEAIRGKIQVIVRAAYTGDPNKGAAQIQKWLDWHEPVSSTFRELPFSEIATISNDSVHPAAVNGSNELLDELSDEAIKVLVHHATNSESPLVAAELRHTGGAIAHVAPDANAIGNRDAAFYFNMGGPIFTPDGKAASIAYIREFKADLKPYLRGNVYLNFMSGDEPAARAKDAYLPAAYKRLVALKAKYDPDNTFRFSYQLV